MAMTTWDDELARHDPNLCEHGWSSLHPQPCPECEVALRDPMDDCLVRIIEDAVEAGIEAAAEAVSNLPMGKRKWNKKEYMIAATAARAAVKLLARRLHGAQPDP